MKTIKDVKSEIAKISQRITDEPIKPSAEKKLRKRIALLNEIIMLLEKQYPVDYFKQEKEKLSSHVLRIRKRFTGLGSRQQKKLDKEYGLDKCLSFISNIDYIIE